eukprot:3942816-Prymnesium_polylepis.1
MSASGVASAQPARAGRLQVRTSSDLDRSKGDRFGVHQATSDRHESTAKCCILTCMQGDVRVNIRVSRAAHSVYE